MGLPPFSQYRVCLRHLIVAGSYGQKYNIFWLFVVYEMIRNISFFACPRSGPMASFFFIASPSEMCYITGSMTCRGVRSPGKNKTIPLSRAGIDGKDPGPEERP